MIFINNKKQNQNKGQRDRKKTIFLSCRFFMLFEFYNTLGYLDSSFCVIAHFEL
jgi:hypothetical protein